jgi:apolipoprotein N-acyltransferase
MRLASADVIDHNEFSQIEPSATIKVAVIQGNIDQAVKWDAQYRQQTLDTYITLSKQTLVEDPELIVWPETAVPFIFQAGFKLTEWSLQRLKNEKLLGDDVLKNLESLKDRNFPREQVFLDAVEHQIGKEQSERYKENILRQARPDYYSMQLTAGVQQFETHLLFGVQDIIPAPPPRNYNSFNSAFLLSPTGELVVKYDKINLVPFGEYVPFKKALFFIDKLVTAIGEVLPGTTYTVMPFDERPFSTLICFEIIFPNLVRKFVDRGAQFLVTITNDAWYGRSSAPYQHFSMATFRAIENRKAVARAANTGISGFIDPYGRVIAQSDIFVEDAIVRVIPVRNTMTFYTQWGDVFARLCCLLAVLWMGYAFYKSRYHRAKGRETMAEMKS